MRYFGYGSNMHLPALRDYLALHGVAPGNIRHPQRAILHDYRLRTNYLRAGDVGAANIEPCVGSEVEGILVEITPAVHRLLRQKEGWSRSYREIAVWVSIPGTDSIAVALTYVVTDEHRLTTDMPVASSYRQTILEGAREAGLSKQYQRKRPSAP